MEFHYFPIEETLRLAERKWIFNYLPKNKIFAEIGVFRGMFSEMIYNYNTPAKLYLVDPWTKIGEYFSWNQPYDDFGKLTTAYAKKEVEERTKYFKNTRVIICEQFSTEFCVRIKEKVDIIYLDSSHNYESSKAELTAMLSILADDGFLCGDDWHYYHGHRHHGVFRAIHEFLKTHDFQIVAAGPGKQWLMQRTSAYDKK